MCWIPLTGPFPLLPVRDNRPIGFKTNIGLGFTAAASIYLKLNDRLHLLGEPYIRYNLSPANKADITLKQKYTTIGFRLGLRLDLWQANEKQSDVLLSITRMTIKTTYLRFLAPALVCCLILLNSCQRDLDYIVQNPNAGPDTTWVNTPIHPCRSAIYKTPCSCRDKNRQLYFERGNSDHRRPFFRIEGCRNGRCIMERFQPAGLRDWSMHDPSCSHEKRFYSHGHNNVGKRRGIGNRRAYFLPFFQKDQEELHVSQGRQIIGIFDAPATFRDMSVYSGFRHHDPADVWLVKGTGFTQ